MEKFKVGDKVLVEVEIVGEDALTKEYQLKPMTNTWTFWAKRGRKMDCAFFAISPQHMAHIVMNIISARSDIGGSVRKEGILRMGA